MGSWYAVYTKTGWETRVATQFERKGIEQFLPLMKPVRRLPGEPAATSNTPVFPSCVFVQADCRQQALIKQFAGVINFFFWLDKLAVFPDEDIQLLHSFLQEHTVARIEKIPVDIHCPASVSFACASQEPFPIFRICYQLSLPAFGYLLTSTFKTSLLEMSQVPAPLHPENLCGLAFS